MINSTFDVINERDYNKDVLSVSYRSAQGTVAAGQTGNVDFTLTDDMFLNGLQLLAKGSNFGDTVTLQIVSLTGTLGNGVEVGPPGTVLNTFGVNVGIVDDVQEKINETTNYPAKILAGMTVRVIYSSTGSADVNLIVNYRMMFINL